MPRNPPAKILVLPTPQDAAHAFYEAFEAADIEAMMAVWAEDEEIICIHPNGPRLIGYQAVRASWEKLFNSETRISFNFSGEIMQQTVSIAIQSLFEHVNVSGESRGVVLATNIFLRTAAGWRMLMHHASPAQAVADVGPIQQLH